MVIMVPDRVMAGLYAMHRPVFLLYPLVVSESETNFLKLRESELRRIPLPRTPLNRGVVTVVRKYCWYRCSESAAEQYGEGEPEMDNTGRGRRYRGRPRADRAAVQWTQGARNQQRKEQA